MKKDAKPFIRIHNAETDEVIDREMTDVELAEVKAMNDAKAAEIAEMEAKAKTAEATKAALLSRLGITADEAKLLLS
jgi:hypothetical protein